MATRRTRMGALLGGPGQRSCPSACLPGPPIQVAARKSRAVIQFFIPTLITLCFLGFCHISTEAHYRTGNRSTVDLIVDLILDALNRLTETCERLHGGTPRRARATVKEAPVSVSI